MIYFFITENIIILKIKLKAIIYKMIMEKEFINDVLENNNNSNYNDYLVKYYDNIEKYSSIQNFLNMNSNNI